MSLVKIKSEENEGCAILDTLEAKIYESDFINW